MKLLLLSLWLLSFTGILRPASLQAEATNYPVRGVVKEIRPDQHQLVIHHETIPDFMDAMTMPFNVKDPALLTNVTVDAEISFQLHVTESESWIDQIRLLDVPAVEPRDTPVISKTKLDSEIKTNSATVQSKNPLRDFKFTNELGQPVSLSDFRGRAIALTFIFTRCPIPEFCPRLSRNFQEVQRQLSAMANAPTNWHLLSVTIDPVNDTPEALKTYAASYQYDPAHWSFLTGPLDRLTELARLCDVQFNPENGFINHNFRTLIINTSNQVQMIFPTSGDLSDSIVKELLKATATTNRIPEK